MDLPTATPTTLIVGGIIVGALFIILTIGAIITNRRRRMARSVGSTPRYRKGSFKRRARALGLTKGQIGMLERIREHYSVRNASLLLENSSLLDSYLSKAIAEVDQHGATDEVKEGQKLALYRIKQAIERNSQKAGPIRSSSQLARNQSVSITTADGKSYDSRVVAILKDYIAVEVPIDDGGGEVRWRKWNPLKVFFWRSNGQGYSFNSKLAGYNTLKGESCAYIQHSSTILSGKQRRFRRKELGRPCYFYPVRIVTVGSGRNESRRALVDTRHARMGTIIEVSSGGCSLRATAVLPKGSLVKIDFETERRASIVSYGKVVQVHRSEASGYVMHVMFTRVSKKNLNQLNSFIYEYG